MWIKNVYYITVIAKVIIFSLSASLLSNLSLTRTHQCWHAYSRLHQPSDRGSHARPGAPCHSVAVIKKGLQFHSIDIHQVVDDGIDGEAGGTVNL